MTTQENPDTIILCETGDETTKAIMDAVAGKKKRLICGTADKSLVTYGGDGFLFNRQYCRENNITVLHSPVAVRGGTVVINAGDLTFNFVTADLQSDWLGAVRQGICEYLIGKGLNATVDNNDILIDGKKVSGGNAGTQGGIRVESIFIAVVSSAELIEKICLKKRTKQPTSLKEYGVTAKEIQDAVINLTKRYMSELPKKQEKPHGKRTLRDVLGNVKVSQDEIRRLQGIKLRKGG